MSANELERQRWNDERRYANWPKRERLTSEVTAPLLEVLAPAQGERILDIGSGGGLAALAAGEVVGGTGAVVGADISGALCRLAEERAAAAGVRNVTFAITDVQTDEIAGAPFDAAMSQFGVMFFDEPVAAFRNIHAHLRPGGRIAFACWQSSESNPWFPANYVAEFAPAPPPPEAGKSATGPFSLADPAQTTGILEAAGFTDVQRTACDLETDVPEDSVLDEDQLTMMGVPEDRQPAAMDAARAQLSRFRIDGGLSRFPLAFQLFAATRP